GRGRRLRWNDAGDRGEEDRDQEEDRRHEAREPRARTLGHARAGLDVRRVARGAEDAAEEGAEGVDPEHPVRPIDPAIRTEPAAFSRDRCDGAGGVEEVGQHEREDREERDDRAELAKYAGDVELTDGTEVGGVEERRRHDRDTWKVLVRGAAAGGIDEDPNDRRADDAEE